LQAIALKEQRSVNEQILYFLDLQSSAFLCKQDNAQLRKELSRLLTEIQPENKYLTSHAILLASEE
jgi:hypothetical protein